MLWAHRLLPGVERQLCSGSRIAEEEVELGGTFGVAAFAVLVEPPVGTFGVAAFELVGTFVVGQLAAARLVSEQLAALVAEPSC